MNKGVKMQMKANTSSSPQKPNDAWSNNDFTFPRGMTHNDSNTEAWMFPYLKIQVVWVCRSVHIVHCFVLLLFSRYRLKVVGHSETSATIHWTTQRHTPKEVNVRM